MDIFGVVFICLWTLFMIAGGVYAFSEYRQIIISVEGILSKSCFKTELLSWDEIQDWGLSYYGIVRYQGPTYYLCFSKNPCLTKNKYSKKLKGKIIKRDIRQIQYAQMVNIVIPFCAERARVKPFVSENKYPYMKMW